MSKKEQDVCHANNNSVVCVEEHYPLSVEHAGFNAQAKARYEFEPDIQGFADFKIYNGLSVLEIGLGLGVDHQQFVEAGAQLYGIDFSQRAIEHTRTRLSAFGLSSNLSVGDAENLVFPDNFFDMVFSWGGLQYTPDINKAVNEIRRVLKPGSHAKIMIYHKWSIVGFMLWIRYALIAIRPFRPMKELFANHLEGPGNKAFSIFEVKRMFSDFSDVHISIGLSPADLLESSVGESHGGSSLALMKKIWPRWFIRKYLYNAGLFMQIKAKK